MIRVITPTRRRSKAQRQSGWHRVFVVHRRFHCPRRGATVRVIFDTIERRRHPGTPWQYRTTKENIDHA